MSRCQIPNLPCLDSTVRRASRALTQMYEQAIRPLGLRSSQFTILLFLSFAGEVSQGRMGEMLAMDSTTLTRTLEIMLEHEWVAERRGDPKRGDPKRGDAKRDDAKPREDRRQRYLRLAKAGKAQLDRALPVWEKVQSQIQSQLGEQSWKDLFRLTNKLTEIATERVP